MLSIRVRVNIKEATLAFQGEMNEGSCFVALSEL